MTEIIVASDTLHNISTWELDVGHAVVVDCDTRSILQKEGMTIVGKCKCIKRNW